MTLPQDALFQAALARLPLTLQEALTHSGLDNTDILQHYTRDTAEVMNFPSKKRS